MRRIALAAALAMPLATTARAEWVQVSPTELSDIPGAVAQAAPEAAPAMTLTFDADQPMVAVPASVEVPAPAALALFGIGLIGLAVARRRAAR